MSAFKIKLGIGLFALIVVFMISQGIYRRNINALHHNTFEVFDVTEQMHTAEAFHSSLHEMLILGGQYAERPAGFIKSEYEKQSKDAADSLRKLKDLSAGMEHIEGSGDREFCVDCVENIASRFSMVKQSLDNVFLKSSDNPAVHLKRAHELFDDIFHNYYLKLHSHHNEQLLKIRGDVHGIKKTMDTYFIGQLVFALLAGIAVLYYIDKVVLKLHAATEHLSLTDTLTSLYNRRHLSICLETELSRSSRFGHPFSVAMIDIDNFKKYNDTYGHQAGDKLLKDLSSIMKNNVRQTDTIFRYGGEEFTILFPETAKTSAVIVADKIRAAIEGASFTLPDKHPAPKVAVSIGVASFPSDGNTSDEIIKKADERLYKAKSEGKNRVKDV
jgi:diguanylate cyclase (GGDEF)-like protein